MPTERLQKILASAGLASRRKAEELITEGRVSVNGETVTELGTKADPRMDEIRVDGELVGGAERPVYLMVYKPKGYVTTVSDPEGRPTIMDLIVAVKERVFPVGRLDYLSEGLLLMTNDGELMAKLTHASSHVAKTYLVKVSGHPTEADLDKLRAGIMLPPEPSLTGAHDEEPGMKRRSFAVRTLPAKIELARDQENPWYEVTLTEGRNRQIRRMFKEIGFHVEKIKRIRYASLELNLEPGQWRSLTVREINEVRKSLDKPTKIYAPRPRAEEVEDETASEERAPRQEAKREFRPKAAATRGKGGFGQKRDTRGKGGFGDKRGFRAKPTQAQRDGARLRSDSERYISRTPRPDRDGERPRPRREFPARNFEDKRPEREGGFAPRGEKSFDRPEKFGDRPPRREGGFDKPKSFDRPRRDDEGGERRSYGAKPSYDRPKKFGDRPPRREGGFDRPPRREGGFDRPKPFDKPRRDDASGERRSYGAKPSFDRPKKFGDRPPRREGGFDRPPRREGSDRPVRFSADGRAEGERHPRKNFGESKSFGDRKSSSGAKKSFGGPKKSFGGPKSFGASKSRGPKSGSNRGDKPYRRG